MWARYDNQFRFPTSILNQIKEALGGDDVLIDTSQHSGLYSVEPGLTYDASANISFSILLTIEDGLTVEIPSHELGQLFSDLCNAFENSHLAVRPLRGLDDDGVPVVNSSLTEVQVFAEEGPGQGPVLGKVFLSQVVVSILARNQHC